MLNDAVMCLLHTFEIFVDEDFPADYAHTFQPPQKHGIDKPRDTVSFR